MQNGFYFDQTRCTGCDACIVACKDWHDIPAGPASWRRVITIEKGKYPDVFVANLSTACYHCGNPLCASACPVDAISKRESDGVVLVDREACLGKDSCGKCSEECPYDAPQFGAGENSKMQKCDGCIDRLAENRKPVCVCSCPMRALDFGPMEELRRKYGDSHDAEGFSYSESLAPSVVFKSKRDMKGLPLQKVDIVPRRIAANGCDQ